MKVCVCVFETAVHSTGDCVTEITVGMKVDLQPSHRLDDVITVRPHFRVKVLA